MRGLLIEILGGSEERSFCLLCQMRYRLNGEAGRVGRTQPSMFCGTPLLILLTLCAEAEEDQKKTWMKNTPHLKYLLVWKKDPGCIPPFPEPLPESSHRTQRSCFK